jgi:hypothetical protein
MPYIKQKRRVCKKCGVSGGIFYAQKRNNRPTKLNIHNICRRCKREDIKDSYYRCTEDKFTRYEKSIENMYMTEVV